MKTRMVSLLLSLFDKLLLLGFAGLVLFSFFGFLPDRPLWVGIFSHFKLQYALAFLLAAGLFLLRRKKVLLGMAMIGALLNGWPVVEVYLPEEVVQGKEMVDKVEKIEENGGQAIGAEGGLGQAIGAERGLGQTLGSERGLGQTLGSERGLGQTLGSDRTGDGEPYSLISLNVLAFNREFDRVRRYLEKEDPDFVMLFEYTPRWHNKIGQVWEKYPYRKVLPRHGFSGSIIASKHPFSEARSIWYGPVDVASLSVRVTLAEKELQLIGIHPPSPPNLRDIGYRNSTMDSLARYLDGIQAEGIPILLAGDFNNTPFHPQMRKFLKHTQLKDSRKGFGNQASFPYHLGWLGIPLDHILVSSEIDIQNRKLGPWLGSDHRAVWCEFSLKNQEISGLSQAILNKPTPR